MLALLVIGLSPFTQPGATGMLSSGSSRIQVCGCGALGTSLSHRGNSRTEPYIIVKDGDCSIEGLCQIYYETDCFFCFFLKEPMNRFLSEKIEVRTWYTRIDRKMGSVLQAPIRRPTRSLRARKHVNPATYMHGDMTQRDYP